MQHNVAFKCILITSSIQIHFCALLCSYLPWASRQSSFSLTFGMPPSAVKCELRYIPRIPLISITFGMFCLKLHQQQNTPALLPAGKIRLNVVGLLRVPAVCPKAMLNWSHG